MSAIKISIVVPNYNHAHYLPIALDHALQQTSPAHEILIIDDGSTDNSLAVIQEYAAKHPQIKLIQNSKNMGVNFTINRGLQEASGSHVIFAAADDWIEPHLLQTAMQLLTAHPTAGLVSGACWIVYEKQLHKRTAARMPYPMRHCGYIAPMRARKLINSLDSWFAGNTVVLNRSYALEESGFREEMQSFTDNFLYRILASKHGCCFTPEKLATWRICKGGFAKSFSLDATKQLAVIQAMEKFMRYPYGDIFSINSIYKFKRRCSFNLARTLWNNNYKLSVELEDFLNITIHSRIIKLLAKVGLKIISKFPIYQRKLGQLLLFILLRPFDIWQQLRIG